MNFISQGTYIKYKQKVKRASVGENNINITGRIHVLPIKHRLLRNKIDINGKIWRV